MDLIKRIVFKKLHLPQSGSLGIWLACVSLGVSADWTCAHAELSVGVAPSGSGSASVNGVSSSKSALKGQVQWRDQGGQVAPSGKAAVVSGVVQAKSGALQVNDVPNQAGNGGTVSRGLITKKRTKARWNRANTVKKEVVVIATLEQALNAAYTFNVEIVNAFAELQKSQENCFINRAEWFPTLDLSGSVAMSRARSQINNNVGTIENVVMRAYEQKEYAKNMRGNLQLAYNLYQGGVTKARNARALEDYRANYWAFVEKIQGVLQATVGSFVNLAKAQELYLLSKTREKSLNAEAMITAKRAVSGDKRTVDASLARANAIQKTLEVNAAYQAYLEAKGKLEVLIGCPVSSEIVFPKPLTLPMWDQAKFKTVALAKHPSIKAALCRQKSAQHYVREIKGTLGPKLDIACDLGAGDDWIYDINQGLNRYPNMNSKLNKGVNVSVSLPLFDGGRRQAQTRQAELGVKQARYGVEAAKRQLLSNIDNVFLAYQSAEQDIQSALEAQKEHGAVFGAAREEYELGATSLLDLIALEEQYTRIAQVVVQAYGNMVINSYSVIELLGRLHPDYLHTMAVSAKYDMKGYREEYSIKMFALGKDEAKTPLYQTPDSKKIEAGSPAMILQPMINPPSNTTLHMGWYPESFSLGASEASPPLDQEMQQWIEDFNNKDPWDSVSSIVKQEKEQEENKELYQALKNLNSRNVPDSKDKKEGESKEVVMAPPFSLTPANERG